MSPFARRRLLLALLPLASCNSNPAARLAPAAAPQTPPSVSAADEAFIDQAASADIFAISAAQLALDRSRNPRIRRFAQHLLDDHTASRQRLKQLAEANGVTMPTGMTPPQSAANAALAHTHANFDREFMRQQAIAHRQSISTYENEINNGYNDDIKAFAQQTLPMLRQHLQTAQSDSRSPRNPRDAAARSPSPTRL